VEQATTPHIFTKAAVDFLPVPDPLARLLTLALSGPLERRTVVRWGMKSESLL